MFCTPLRFDGRSCEFMSGNHRGDRSLFSIRLRLRKGGWGICSIRIDFQLGTNGGDANRVTGAAQALICNASVERHNAGQKRLQDIERKGWPCALFPRILSGCHGC